MLPGSDLPMRVVDAPGCAMRFLTVVLVAMLVIPGTASAEVYKWVDEDGTVHFTDKPPPNQKTEEVKLDNAQGRSVASTGGSKEADPDADPADLELCDKAIRNLRRFTPVWERKIRERMPQMAPQERQQAEQALVELKKDLRNASSLNECVNDMADATNRRNANCLANAPDADTAMFCVL